MSRAARLVERGGELAPVLARERVFDAELVENPDDDAAQVVAHAVRRGEGGQDGVERRLAVAAVKRGKGLGQVGLAGLLEPDAGGEAFGGEIAGGRVQDLQRLVVLAALAQDARE